MENTSESDKPISREAFLVDLHAQVNEAYEKCLESRPSSRTSETLVSVDNPHNYRDLLIMCYEEIPDYLYGASKDEITTMVDEVLPDQLKQGVNFLGSPNFDLAYGAKFVKDPKTLTVGVKPTILVSEKGLSETEARELYIKGSSMNELKVEDAKRRLVSTLKGSFELIKDAMLRAVQEEP